MSETAGVRKPAWETSDVMGRLVIDSRRHVLGRVVAVIHTAKSADVLVERRRLLFRIDRLRIAGDRIVELDDGMLQVLALIHGDRVSGKETSAA